MITVPIRYAIRLFKAPDAVPICVRYDNGQPSVGIDWLRCDPHSIETALKNYRTLRFFQ